MKKESLGTKLISAGACVLPAERRITLPGPNSITVEGVASRNGNKVPRKIYHFTGVAH